ncbi:NAD(P)H-dependent flavin oxidoreductase [Methyloligella solikamskensis]|uniref:Propionate 3-nitronate monooxygenase n=1 Tax=Methyloligella solikamskensis TaxID=1177756 RepID=A0ABW3J5A3_9HYPH
MHDLLSRLGLKFPIFQAPMAGTATPKMAAAVSESGGLGSVGLASAGPDGAKEMIVAIRAASNRPFNVNLFCHRPATPNPARESAWLDRLRPSFESFGSEPPAALREINTSFLIDEAMLDVLLEQRPPVISFHLGLPQPEKVAALKKTGAILVASATNLAEGEAAVAAGMDAVVAQGYEAGGHRGIFDPEREDTRLGTFALTRLLVEKLPIPVIAAGGIMDGAGIAAALDLGAVAAQLGTAFIGCPESAADEGYRKALQSDAAYRTEMIASISGRPARCLANHFTVLASKLGDGIPDYPIAYDAAKALNAAAKAAGETGFGPQWAGQGAPLARPMPAAALVARLGEEWRAAVATSRP